MSVSTIVAGVCLLALVSVGVMILWVVDARRADRVAGDTERVEGRADGPADESGRRRRRWTRSPDGR